MAAFNDTLRVNAFSGVHLAIVLVLRTVIIIISFDTDDCITNSFKSILLYSLQRNTSIPFLKNEKLHFNRKSEIFSKLSLCLNRDELTGVLHRVFDHIMTFNSYNFFYIDCFNFNSTRSLHLPRRHRRMLKTTKNGEKKEIIIYCSLDNLLAMSNKSSSVETNFMAYLSYSVWIVLKMKPKTKSR